MMETNVLLSDLHSLAKDADEGWKNYQATSKLWSHEARKTPSSTWLSLLSYIDNHDIKLNVAAILWWDYVCGDEEDVRTQSELHSLVVELSTLMKRGHDPEDPYVYRSPKTGDVVNALHAIGFPKSVAKKRVPGVEKTLRHVLSEGNNCSRCGK